MVNTLYLSETELRTRGGALDRMLDSLFDNGILLDRDCRILYITASDQKELIGQHVSVIDQVSPFEAVLRSGRPQLDLLLELHGRQCLSSLFPVSDGEGIIGVVGTITVRSLARLKRVATRISDQDEGFQGLYRGLSRIDSGYNLEDFRGESPAVKDLLEKARKAANSGESVLILGETGTGKEIIAGGIHAERHRGRPAPYVTINCTAIPEQLMEAELFGHEKGAFTGATETRLGKFQLAGDGDILLDEIGDMDLNMQSKLLRVLEEREFERVGGIKTIPLEARVISSTNSDLLQKCKDNRFRRDLYYRLSTVEIRIPPLRERPDDIPLLVSHFISRENLPIAITDPAMEAMVEYAWPGNVRELRNIIQRLGISCPDRPVRTDDVIRYFSDGSLAAPLFPGTGDSAFPPYVHIHPEQAQARETLLNVLREQHWNLSAAARVLHITRATLYKRLKKYNITVQRRGS